MQVVGRSPHTNHTLYLSGTFQELIWRWTHGCYRSKSA